MKIDFIEKGAEFSTDRVYRYSLWRTWDLTKQKLLWLMLNPSTADEAVEDPTIRRCIGYAHAWGYGGVFIANIFALRSTDPMALYSRADPIGPQNDAMIKELATRKDVGGTIAAWGSHGRLLQRGKRVREMLRSVGIQNLCALALTQDGEPRHPLYLRGDLVPFPFSLESIEAHERELSGSEAFEAVTRAFGEMSRG